MNETRLFPIFLDLAGRLCVVIGGGAVAERKARGFVRAGAKVRVVAPRVSAGLSRLARSGAITLVRRRFSRRDLKDAFLVACATDDERLNRRAAVLSSERGALVNVADSPGLCDFFLPALVRRGPLCVAVSTGGSSPLVAKRIRREIEERYGREYGEMIAEMGALRARVIDAVPAEKRARAYAAMAAPRIARLFKRGRRTEGRREMEKVIERFQGAGARRGGR